MIGPPVVGVLGWGRLIRPILSLHRSLQPKRRELYLNTYPGPRVWPRVRMISRSDHISGGGEKVGGMEGRKQALGLPANDYHYYSIEAFVEGRSFCQLRASRWVGPVVASWGPQGHGCTYASRTGKSGCGMCAGAVRLT
jgi:hypothetical protein